MPKRDHYSILGVPAGVNVQAIQNAYQRLALKVHPDAGKEPDPARFREVHDAYLFLSDAARRRSYGVEIGHATGSRIPVEEISARRPIIVPHDFESVSPSLGEMLDHIAQNFFGFHHKSGGPRRRLELQIVLGGAEALMGGRLPIEVPCYEPCARCQARAWMWGVCPLCHGYGLAESSRQVMLDIPPGIRNGSRYEIALERVGISNLILDVMVLVA
jgi:DnaJ-class molecular chaperone